ncbi:histamine H3 receptor-like [Xenopus laevis]|uniref:Histamine H3 receptor-like n=1 Tax=Xenopus laevis TaxID=8355 RepID=A0A8J1KZ86_XENLA|nr:histamine H3 receptor-like [Xenopus laevis]
MNSTTAGNFSLIGENTGLELQISKGIAILITLLTSCLISLTVLGNTFVIVAFIVDKRLRNQSDFVLLNLAICDFTIGAFTSPMYIPYFMTGKWRFGRFLCRLWLTVDYTVCTASSLTVALISYDRYLSVTKPVLYRSLQNKRSHTFVSIGSVWIFSFLLYGPAILAWKNDDIDNTASVTTCVPGFNDIWYFKFGTSCADFALPVISISFFNLSIYCNIKKRGRKKRQKSILELSKGQENYGNDGNVNIIATNSVLFSGDHGTKKKLALCLRHCFAYRKPSSFTHTDATLQHRNISQVNLSRDEKIAKSLSILVCAFVVCWAPFTFLASIRAACSGYCVESYCALLAFVFLAVGPPAIYLQR